MSNILKKNNGNEERAEVRKGPWTLEEDTLLTNCIAHNGEGRWILLAKSSGLKRTGKNCRLRWLNYLKPDIKRGNITPQEQLVILELHSILGNTRSKIAQHLPGRTDNEIQNYWRTRVQKQARQLNIYSSSHKFLEVLRSFWVPKLTHKMKENSNTSTRVAPPQQLGLSNNDFSHHDSGYTNMDCSTSMSQELKKVSRFRDLSDLETTGSIYLEGSRGSSSQCVSEDYSSFACLEEDYLVASMGSSDISPLQNRHVADLTYEEGVTQDPIWNMDNISQFQEYSRF